MFRVDVGTHSRVATGHSLAMVHPLAPPVPSLRWLCGWGCVWTRRGQCILGQQFPDVKARHIDEQSSVEFTFCRGTQAVVAASVQANRVRDAAPESNDRLYAGVRVVTKTGPKVCVGGRCGDVCVGGHEPKNRVCSPPSARRCLHGLYSVIGCLRLPAGVPQLSCCIVCNRCWCVALSGGSSSSSLSCVKTATPCWSGRTTLRRRLQVRRGVVFRGRQLRSHPHTRAIAYCDRMHDSVPLRCHAVDRTGAGTVRERAPPRR